MKDPHYKEFKDLTVSGLWPATAPLSSNVSAKEETDVNSESKELIALEKLATQGEASAEFDLGQILYFGRYVFGVHVPQDKRMGFELISKAAKKKYEPAIQLLTEIRPRVRAARRAEISKSISELITSIFGLGVAGIIILGIFGLIMFGLQFLFK